MMIAERLPRHAAVMICFVLLALLPLLSVEIGNPFLLRLATRIMIYAVATVSLNLLLGYGGMMSLGHVAFMGIGAYSVGILDWHAANGEPLLTWPVIFAGSTNGFIVWPLAVLAAAAAAALIGALSLRLEGINFIMITLAFAQMLYYFFVALRKYGGDDGLLLSGPSTLGPLDLGNRIQFYYLALAVLVLTLALVDRIVRSRFGMVLQGIRQNERRLRAIGYPTYLYRLAAFVIAGAIAGLAGILMAEHQQFVSPSQMSWEQSGELVIMVILGGVGTAYGPVLGAAIYLLLELVLGSYTTHWQIIFGPFFIIAVLVSGAGWPTRLGLALRRFAGARGNHG